MDPEEDEGLLWIAREGLTAPVPEPWEALEDENYGVVYYNKDTKQISYEHPLDEEYKALYQEKKAQLKEAEEDLGDLGDENGAKEMAYNLSEGLNEELDANAYEELLNQEKEVSGSIT